METAGEGLPPNARFVRATAEMTVETVPPGLRRAHRIADGVWGLLTVSSGTVRFVLEETTDIVEVGAGGSHVIAPGVRHHVDPSDDARFLIEFYRVE